MSHKTREDLALDRLLDRAALPPQMSGDLAARIAARAMRTPQRQNAVAAPYATGMALAASLALGIWLGATGIGVEALTGLSETASLDEMTAEDFTGLGDIEALSEGETL